MPLEAQCTSLGSCQVDASRPATQPTSLYDHLSSHNVGPFPSEFQVQGQIGSNVEGFSGIPVFQSRSLVLKSQNKRYHPVFFRKEDLEESLLRASQQQNYLNPALRKGDIQVSGLEEMIAAMKGTSTSKWDDIIFIPPGFNAGLALEQPVATA